MLRSFITGTACLPTLQVPSGSGLASRAASALGRLVFCVRVVLDALFDVAFQLLRRSGGGGGAGNGGKSAQWVKCCQ